MIVKLNTGQSIKVKEGTSIIVHVPRVIEGVLYARFYADDDRLIETQVVNVDEVAPDETLKPLPVRYRDLETNAVIAQNTAADAQDATETRTHEHETDRDGRQICTTSGDAPSKVRAEQTEPTGQHKSYIVLCEDERKKGFVRPYRDAYKHVGSLVPRCQVTQQSATDENPHQCRRNASHPEDHEFDELMILNGPIPYLLGRLGGCGSVTTMGRSLSETYARDPKFYGQTFCVSCNRHLPVAEFVWTTDNQQVGS